MHNPKNRGVVNRAETSGHMPLGMCVSTETNKLITTVGLAPPLTNHLGRICDRYTPPRNAGRRA